MMSATYLPVRLVSQRKNFLRWSGTCNVTSLAMALSHALPETCTVTPDGLFALLAVAFQNEKLLTSVKKTATVTHVRSGHLRSGEVENFYKATGLVKSSEFLKRSPAYIGKILASLGKEEAFEDPGDNGPKGRVTFRVTNDQLYRNVWYKLKVARAKTQPPVLVEGGYLEKSAKWEGEADIEKLTLSTEVNRVPLGVMRINLSGESLLEVGRIVCGMAAVHGKVWLGMEAEGLPVLYLGDIRHDLSHGQVAPELVQEMAAYRDAGSKFAKWGASVKPDTVIDRIKSLVTGGKVAIISGRFTGSGHIVLACGYTEEEGKVTGIVIADPWGKGSYEDNNGQGGREYADQATDALCVYSAESFQRSIKYIAAEFGSLGGKKPTKRGTVGFKSVGQYPVAVVAPISIETPAPH